jgi:hypothetical protein
MYKESKEELPEEEPLSPTNKQTKKVRTLSEDYIIDE